MIRQTVYFSGRVQGVGFRYMAVRIAQRYVVGGYARNLKDGRVELVAEGTADQVHSLVQDIADHATKFVVERAVDQSEATGEFGTPCAGALQVRY